MRYLDAPCFFPENSVFFWAQQFWNTTKTGEIIGKKGDLQTWNPSESSMFVGSTYYVNLIRCLMRNFSVSGCHTPSPKLQLVPNLTCHLNHYKFISGMIKGKSGRKGVFCQIWCWYKLVTFEVSFVVLNALWEPVAIGWYIPFRYLSCSILVFK